MAIHTVSVRKIIISKHFSRTISNWHKTIVKAIGEEGGGEEGAESRCTQRIFATCEKGQFVVSCSHFRYVLEKEESLKRHHIFQHISHRNRLTIRLLQLIEEHRSQWLASNNPLHLTPWRAAELIAAYNSRWQDVILDASTLSRLINHTHVQVHGKRTLLKSLFPGRAQWIGAHIRALLAFDPLWVDRELQQQLAARYGIEISARYLSMCRKHMGIPAKAERMGNSTPPLCLERRSGSTPYWSTLTTAPVSMRSAGISPAAIPVVSQISSILVAAAN